MNIAKVFFKLKTAAVSAGAFTVVLTMPAAAQQSAAQPESPRAGAVTSPPQFSPFTAVEQKTIVEVTMLLERYVAAYSGMGNAREYASLWTFPNGGSASNNSVRPGSPSYDALLKGVGEYFSQRSAPLKTVSSEISVRPINDIAALGHIRFNFQETPNSTQRSFTSVYLCVKTEAGWRLTMAMDGKDGGISFLNAGTSHRVWNIKE